MRGQVRGLTRVLNALEGLELGASSFEGSRYQILEPNQDLFSTHRFEQVE